MELSIIFFYAIGIVILFIIGMILIIPIKVIGKLVLNSIVGALILFVLNYVFKIVGLQMLVIGINPITALVVGLLGIPGVGLLVILKFIL